MHKVLRFGILLASLSFVIFFHELGHFIACKLFNVATPVFSLGFGPPVVHYTFGETTFQIAALPFGGFVSMRADDLVRKPYWQKMVIVLAGIFNNLLLGFILLFIIIYYCRNHTTPGMTADTIPVSIQPAELKNRSIFQIIKEALHAVGFILYDYGLLLTGLGKFSEKKDSPTVDTIAFIRQAPKNSLTIFLFFLATISIQIGIFNSLPIPFLDGGQALDYTLEALKGSALSVYEQKIINLILVMTVVIILLMAHKKKRTKKQV